MKAHPGDVFYTHFVGSSLGASPGKNESIPHEGLMDGCPFSLRLQVGLLLSWCDLHVFQSHELSRLACQPFASFQVLNRVAEDGEGALSQHHAKLQHSDVEPFHHAIPLCSVEMNRTIK